MIGSATAAYKTDRQKNRQTGQTDIKYVTLILALKKGVNRYLLLMRSSAEDLALPEVFLATTEYNPKSSPTTL